MGTCLTRRALAKGRHAPGFLKLLLSVTSVCVCVCVSVCACVSTPESINYIHMIFNLYNQLNNFVALET